MFGSCFRTLAVVIVSDLFLFSFSHDLWLQRVRTPSMAFRHIPPVKGVVNYTLEFAACADFC